ncbi:chorismate mutase [Ostreococcus tauri]|uniref:Chorismate mutase n=1 Tax=Ostreococcus tauri TaxID=70448 RepID=A0A1Y5IBZ5_OSTTA|nr:chorismate mutase [Ostreococcus tauri]
MVATVTSLTATRSSSASARCAKSVRNHRWRAVGRRERTSVCASPVASAVDGSVDYEDTSDRLKLENVRQSLIRQEDSIIFALIERAQYKLNRAVYSKNAVPVPCFAPNGDRASMLEYMLRDVEQSHGRIRRYTSPDEHAFYPEAQPPLAIPPISFKDVLHPAAEAININDRIMDMYVNNLLPEMCEGGDDNNYGSSALCDLACLQTISRRIHYGKYVAESKFQAQPEEYTELIMSQDAEGLMRLLTNQAVEDRVVRRVANKAAVFGTDITEDIPEGLALPIGSESMKLAPEKVGDLYYRWIMPMTKDVQVAYLLRRLD